ncbi:MAG TPA: hypothetical protein PLO86_11580, partial [Syntrophales bacterium]|nr:hypothetical protein [Syntrophales bacterium]
RRGETDPGIERIERRKLLTGFQDPPGFIRKCAENRMNEKMIDEARMLPYDGSGRKRVNA